MTTQVIGGEALTRLVARFRALANGPTTDEWHVIGKILSRVMAEDNRKGVLTGTDKDDRRMPPLKYRNGKAIRAKAREGKKLGKVNGRFKGSDASPKFGKLSHNNLTTAEYQRLTGPRLAPRGDESRVISNYVQTYKVDRAGNRYSLIVTGKWKDVLTPRGDPLLPMHFEGLGRNPKYDLRGVRKWGMTQCRTESAAWLRALIARRLGR